MAETRCTEEIEIRKSKLEIGNWKFGNRDIGRELRTERELRVSSFDFRVSIFEFRMRTSDVS